MDFFAQWRNGCRRIGHFSGFQREILPRMRVECQYGGGQPERVGSLTQSGEQRFVSTMHAVEVTDRQCAWPLW